VEIEQSDSQPTNCAKKCPLSRR